ncbi:hypothetical protein P692DRAFT_20255408 [Suillus brevipes Sb2]|nr:hypothetical protein P692DRAFT_20255408 [Suillus brevipes Sb2]
MAIDCRSIYLGNDEWIEHKGNSQKVHVRLGFARTASLPSNPGIQTPGRVFHVTGIPRMPGIDILTLSNNMGSFPPDMVIIFTIRDFDPCETQQRSQSAFSTQTVNHLFIYFWSRLAPPSHLARKAVIFEQALVSTCYWHLEIQ